MDISFVLSNGLKYRVGRHIAFWLVMLTYQGMVDFIVPALTNGADTETFRDAFELVLIYLPGQLILAYGLVYGVIPYFLLRRKYVWGILLIGILCIVAGIANEISYRIFTKALIHLLPDTGKHTLGLHRMLGVAGFAGCIKFIKLWYAENVERGILEQEKLTLEKEKLQAELKSLKAQIHPHFLFNTLNNIYSITQDASKEASDMLLRLSSLLRYILYECNKPEITLEQEFKIIRDYIVLESIRYGKELDIHVDLPVNRNTYYIAPLLLLPLVENCFKHGTSKMIDQAWINIRAEVKDNKLDVKLINGRPFNNKQEVEHNEGIGLHNVRQRLSLLYPSTHELKIIPEENVFVVALKLELHQ